MKSKSLFKQIKQSYLVIKKNYELKNIGFNIFYFLFRALNTLPFNQFAHFFSCTLILLQWGSFDSCLHLNFLVYVHKLSIENQTFPKR